MTRNWDTSIKTKITTVCTSLALSCLSSQVFASGFAILEQNVTNLGLAYSGTAALAEDASTGYFNAAGLTRLGESQVVLGGVLINSDADFTATDAQVSFNNIETAIPVPGSLEDDAGRTAFVPNFHIAKRLDNRWVFGFSVSSPFGLNTKYQETSIARYLATNSGLQTLNLSPSLAYEVLPCLSIGAGADAMWGKANLESAVGYGTFGTIIVPPGVPLTGTNVDGFVKNNAEGWGFGYHAGLLWTPWEKTRVGVNYRSKITINGEGDAEILNPYLALGNALNVTLPSSGSYFIERVHAKLELPDTATLSIYQGINEQFAVTADVAWTHWERFNTLSLRYAPPVATSALTPDTSFDTDTFENFKNSWRYALGLLYTYDANWQFKIGTAFDKTPTQDDNRTARLPDEDRIWAAIGVAYTVNESLRFDAGYAHLFFDDAVINEHAPYIANTTTPITSSTLSGSYKASANLVGIQMRYDFV